MNIDSYTVFSSSSWPQVDDLATFEYVLSQYKLLTLKQISSATNFNMGLRNILILEVFVLRMSFKVNPFQLRGIFLD